MFYSSMWTDHTHPVGVEHQQKWVWACSQRFWLWHEWQIFIYLQTAVFETHEVPVIVLYYIIATCKNKNQTKVSKCMKNKLCAKRRKLLLSVNTVFYKTTQKMILVFCPNMGLTYVSTIKYADFFSATVPN